MVGEFNSTRPRKWRNKNRKRPLVDGLCIIVDNWRIVAPDFPELPPPDCFDDRDLKTLGLNSQDDVQITRRGPD